MTGIVDLFAGPGGWDEGLRALGRHEDCIGIEWDEAACQTARAAGHARLQADLAALDPQNFGPIDGLIASPPCQAYSAAGRGLGRQDRPIVEECIRELADGVDLRWQHAGACLDPRSLLTAEPMRWAEQIRPRWIACEQVPAVLPLWELMADLLSGLGYSCDTGYLSAEQYGVPQTRKRAYLVASLDGLAALPAPTHTRYRKGKARQEGDLLPWVSMADALGWTDADALEQVRGAGMVERHGSRPMRQAGEPAFGLTGHVTRYRHWTQDRPSPTIATTRRGEDGIIVGRQLPDGQAINRGGWKFRADAQKNAAVRDVTEPGPTIRFGHSCAQMGWTPDGEDVRRNGIRITVKEASVLMGFPADYPWQGAKTKQFQQIGNAVCPPVGAAVLAAVMGVEHA